MARALRLARPEGSALVSRDGFSRARKCSWVRAPLAQSRPKAGTTHVVDIPWTSASNRLATPLYEAGDTTFVGVEQSNHFQLWASDGTKGGTRSLHDFGSRRAFHSFVEFGKELYFTITNWSDVAELWKTDGTAEGTVLVKDLGVARGDLGIANGTLFVGITSPESASLTSLNTQSSDLTVVRQFARPFNIDGPRSWYFTALDDRLFFVQSESGKNYLWISDGATEGTRSLTAIRDDRSGLGTSVAVDDRLFFNNWDSTAGEELWVFDGTPEGTHLYADITPDGGSNPSGFTIFRGHLYFRAIDAVHGSSLFRLSTGEDPQVLMGGTAAYVENSAPLTVSPYARLDVAWTSDFKNGTFSAFIDIGAGSGDVLAIHNQGSSAGQIGIVGSQVTFAGQVIGKWTISDGTQLEVVLNDQATPESIEALVRSITFESLGEAPTTTSRTIRFALQDNDGRIGEASKTVNVHGINDAPQLDNELSPRFVSTAEDAVTPSSSLVSSLLTGAVTDPDANALRGIAVTGASNYHGTWEFSTNGAKASQTMGEVDETAARLLPGWARVRFVPKADFNGT